MTRQDLKCLRQYVVSSSFEEWLFSEYRNRALGKDIMFAPFMKWGPRMFKLASWLSGELYEFYLGMICRELSLMIGGRGMLVWLPSQEKAGSKYD